MCVMYFYEMVLDVSCRRKNKSYVGSFLVFNEYFIYNCLLYLLIEDLKFIFKCNFYFKNGFFLLMVSKLRGFDFVFRFF